jgi:hypothetical protein
MSTAPLVPDLELVSPVNLDGSPSLASVLKTAPIQLTASAANARTVPLNVSLVLVPINVPHVTPVTTSIAKIQTVLHALLDVLPVPPQVLAPPAKLASTLTTTSATKPAQPEPMVLPT